MNRYWRNIHSAFKLNGIHYNLKELQEVGYSLIKEGNPFEKTIGDFLLDWTSDGPSLIVETSGSTGQPKQIALKKEHMVNSAMATGEYFGLNPSAAALLCLPCTGIAGKMMLVRAMVLGLELNYVEPSLDPLADTQKSFDFAAMVPLQVEKSMGKLSQIKTLIIGGAPVSHGLNQKLQPLSTHCFETYGMTETITHIAVRRIENSKFKIQNSQKPIVQQSNFTALPNISFSQDTRGCLVIDAPKIADKKIATNDIVELISETKFQWLGRYDTIINSGGVKLIPEQIEKKLATVIPGRFFVTGMEDVTLGQKLVLVLEGESHLKKELKQPLENLEGLTKYEIPKEILTVANFKETATGKVQKSLTMKSILR